MKEVIRRSTLRKVPNVSRNVKKNRNSKNILKIRKIKSSHKSTEANSSTSVVLNNKEEFIDYYSSQENKAFLDKVRNDFLSLENKMQQSQSISIDFLTRHAINAQYRANVIDYIYLLIISTKTEIQTFFLCVYIFDSFIAKVQKSIDKEELTIIAFTSLLIASKQESTIPFTVNDILSVINQSVSSSETISNDIIKQKEIEIILTVNFDFVEFSLYDIIQIFLNDLKCHLDQEITKSEIDFYFKQMNDYSIEVCKSLLLDVSFYKYNLLLTGIASIVISYDLMCSKAIPEKIFSFFTYWINQLLERYPKKEVKEIYSDIRRLMEPNSSTKSK